MLSGFLSLRSVVLYLCLSPWCGSIGCLHPLVHSSHPNPPHAPSSYHHYNRTRLSSSCTVLLIRSDISSRNPNGFCKHFRFLVLRAHSAFFDPLHPLHGVKLVGIGLVILDIQHESKATILCTTVPQLALQRKSHDGKLRHYCRSLSKAHVFPSA